MKCEREQFYTEGIQLVTGADDMHSYCGGDYINGGEKLIPDIGTARIFLAYEICAEDINQPAWQTLSGTTMTEEDVFEDETLYELNFSLDTPIEGDLKVQMLTPEGSILEAKLSENEDRDWNEELGVFNYLISDWKPKGGEASVKIATPNDPKSLSELRFRFCSVI